MHNRTGRTLEDPNDPFSKVVPNADGSIGKNEAFIAKYVENKKLKDISDIMKSEDVIRKEQLAHAPWGADSEGVIANAAASG